jgi:hypothetical protein
MQIAVECDELACALGHVAGCLMGEHINFERISWRGIVTNHVAGKTKAA